VLNVYEDYDKCILHCEKHDYDVDFASIGFLLAFRDELVECITGQAFKNTQEETISENSFRIYLIGKRDDKYKDIEYLENQLFEFSKKASVILTNIIFPQTDPRDHFDYPPVLEKLGSIHFNFCKFRTVGFEFVSTKCFFQDCEFLNNWHICNMPVLENCNALSIVDSESE
jgi:hypothetical protein